VFQKVVLYTMLFEVIGLGCGFGPLNNRFYPPIGSVLYWMRPTHPVATVAESRPDDQGHRPHPAGCRVVRGATGDDIRHAVCGRDWPGAGAGHHVGLLPEWRVVLILVLLGFWGCGTR